MDDIACAFINPDGTKCERPAVGTVWVDTSLDAQPACKIHMSEDQTLGKDVRGDS